jgi:hypothetical protein
MIRSQTGQGHILAEAVTLLGQVSQSGHGHEHDVACTRMLDSSDVEVFILAAVCKETEKKKRSKGR